MGTTIESFNISLKNMYNYFTKNNKYIYLDVINNLLTSYNYNSYVSK